MLLVDGLALLTSSVSRQGWLEGSTQPELLIGAATHGPPHMAVSGCNRTFYWQHVNIELVFQKKIKESCPYLRPRPGNCNVASIVLYL